jgi:hypothetical protein
MLTVWLFALSLPSFVRLKFFQEDIPSIAMLSFFDEVVGLSFLVFLARKYFHKYHITSAASWRDSLRATLLYGLIFWALLTLPSLLEDPITTPTPTLFFLLAAALSIYFTFYFYFVPTILGHVKPSTVLALARTYTSRDMLLPFRVLFAPLAIMFLFNGLIFSQSPDGRALYVDYLSALSFGLQRLLATVLEVSFALFFLPRKELPFYAPGASAPSTISGPTTPTAPWLTSILSAQHGFLVATFALLLWAHTLTRLETMPPSAVIEIGTTKVKGNVVHIEFQATDTNAKFRGFIPANFSLAGPKRTILAASPKKATNEKGEDVRYGVPAEGETTRISLEFETDRTAEQLTLLKDVYLWYRQVKMSAEPLTFSVNAADGVKMEDANSDPPPPPR